MGGCLADRPVLRHAEEGRAVGSRRVGASKTALCRFRPERFSEWLSQRIGSVRLKERRIVIPKTGI